MMIVVVSKIVPSLMTERKGNITRNITFVLFIGVSRAGRFIDGHAWCELIFGFTLTQRAAVTRFDIEESDRFEPLSRAPRLRLRSSVIRLVAATRDTDNVSVFTSK